MCRRRVIFWVPTQRVEVITYRRLGVTWVSSLRVNNLPIGL